MRCHGNHDELPWEIKVLLENEAIEAFFIVYLSFLLEGLNQ